MRYLILLICMTNLACDPCGHGARLSFARATHEIPAGTKLEAADFELATECVEMQPLYIIPAEDISSFIGKKTTGKIGRDEIITETHFGREYPVTF